MCGTASSQKRHTYLLQFVMLSIYHLFNRISIHLHHLQRYFIKIRAAVHHFVQQSLCMMSYCTNRRPDRCFMPENTWFRKLRPKSHPDILLEWVPGWLSSVYERGRLASAADKEAISAAPASKPCWQRSYLVFTWIYRKAAANFSGEPENRVQKVL